MTTMRSAVSLRRCSDIRGLGPTTGVEGALGEVLHGDSDDGRW